LGIEDNCFPYGMEVTGSKWASERGLLSIEEGGLNGGGGRGGGGGGRGNGRCTGRHVGSSCLSCCCCSSCLDPLFILC